MKAISANKLKRFWVNGVLPIKTSLASKVNTSDIVNNFTTTVANKVADARALKTLMDKINELNRNIQNMTFKDYSAWGNLSPGDLNTTTRRFANSNVSSVRELVFVLYQGGNSNESIYEYVHIATPFGELERV